MIFKDSTNREWKIELNFGAVKRVKEQVHVDLLKITEPVKEGDELPLMTALADDIALLCDVIFSLVKPQADDAGVSDEEFGRSLGGEAIVAASDAFWKELHDFFHSLRRTNAAAAIGKQTEMIDKAMALATSHIEAVDVDVAMKSLEAEIKSTLGPKFGD